MLMKDAIKEFVYECGVRKYTKRTIKGYKNNNLLFATYIENEEEFNIKKKQLLGI